jgi:hypothetical protein
MADNVRVEADRKCLLEVDSDLKLDDTTSITTPLTKPSSSSYNAEQIKKCVYRQEESPDLQAV